MQSFFHSTEKKSLNQQTGADGVQTILAPTQSKTKGRRWYVSVNGSVKANLCTVLKKNRVSEVNWIGRSECKIRGKGG